MTYNDLVSWVVRNQKFGHRNYKFIKFLIPLKLFFDKSNSKIRRWSYPVWGHYCNEWSIYYLPFVFVTHWSNRSKDFFVFELVLSWFSNLINIMNKICWVKLYCPIKKPECKFSFCFVNRLFKPNKQIKNKNICSLKYPMRKVSSIMFHFLPILSTYLDPSNLLIFSFSINAQNLFYTPQLK